MTLIKLNIQNGYRGRRDIVDGQKQLRDILLILDHAVVNRQPPAIAVMRIDDAVDCGNKSQQGDDHT